MVELYQTKPIQVRAVEYTGTNKTEIERFVNAVVLTYPANRISKNSYITITKDKVLNFPIDIARKYTKYTADDCFDSILTISINDEEKYYIINGEYLVEQEGELKVLSKEELEENYDKFK